MNITLSPAQLSLLRTARKGPMRVVVTPSARGARLTSESMGVGHAVSLTVPCDAVTPLTLEWADLARAVKAAKGGAFDGTAKSIRAGRFTFAIETKPAERVKVRAQTVVLRMDDAAITRALARLVPSISQDECRPHLACLHVARKGSVVVMESTDGHRLARHTFPSEGADFDVLMPEDAVRSLATMHGRLTLRCDRVAVGNPPKHETYLLARRGSVRVACTAVDASFPKTEQVIPTTWEREVTVDAGALHALFAQIKYVCGAAVADQGDMTLAGDGTSLRLTVLRGEFSMTVDPIPYVGVAFPASGFAVRYVRDALPTSGPVLLRMSNAMDPMAVIDGDMTAVVMPKRL